jgi:ATP-binding protein involved in chromosome partitioning
MAQKTNMRLVGAIENMSYLIGTGEEIFGSGGGQQLADELDIPLLGRVPLDPALREAADEGEPLVWTQPKSETSQSIVGIAENLAEAHRPTFKPLPVLS